MILKALVLAALLLAAAGPAFAQLAADPNDRLYTDLEIWMDRGLTGPLPALRPYPVQLVKKILADVNAKGNDTDRERAANYLAKIDGVSNAHAVASSLGRASAGTSPSDVYAELGLQAFLQGSITSYLTYSAKVGALLVGPGSWVLPEYQRSLTDYVTDPSNSAFAVGLTPKMAMVGGASVGSDSIYVQGGVLRSSYGPFWGDNVVLSPTAPQSGQFSFAFHEAGMSGTLLFMEISPTDNAGNGTATFGKFLSLGGFEFYPFDWLSLGVFDTIVWGQRFEPLYLLPVISFYTQGMVGYQDNSFLGLSAGIKLPQNVKADFLLYIDDMGTQWSHLDFNFMLLAALQAGLTWTPNLPFLTRLRVTNVLVTPYTYSHLSYSGQTLNYLNYTNQGQNMGPSIQPDSYRLEIEALVRPTTWLDLTTFGRFVLHGNASAGFPNMPFPADGSVYDNGVDSNGNYIYAPSAATAGQIYTRFLTQSFLEKVFQVGFDAKAYLETPVGEIQPYFSYTLEVVFNGSIAGTGPVSGNDTINHYLGVGLSITY